MRAFIFCHAVAWNVTRYSYSTLTPAAEEKRMWINGVAQDTLSARDRAVQFGDGCFTTAAVKEGRIQLLEAHLQRLDEGCQRLLMAAPDRALLAEEMRCGGPARSGAQSDPHAGRGRTRSRAGCTQPTRIIALAPCHSTTPRCSSRARLVTSPVRLAQNPLLAGIKHLNRLEQVLIRQQLDACDADEALVLDTAGTVVECCAANLFWRSGEVISRRASRRPALMASCVVICWRSWPEPVTTASRWASRTAVLSADEVVICNALMPVLPVRQIDDVTFSARTLYQQLLASCQTMEAS